MVGVGGLSLPKRLLSAGRKGPGGTTLQAVLLTWLEFLKVPGEDKVGKDIPRKRSITILLKPRLQTHTSPEHRVSECTKQIPECSLVCPDAESTHRHTEMSNSLPIANCYVIPFLPAVQRSGSSTTCWVFSVTTQALSPSPCLCHLHS